MKRRSDAFGFIVHVGHGALGGALVGGLRGVGLGLAVAPVVSLLATRADFSRRVADLPAFARHHRR